MANLATISNNILADSGIDDINVVVTTGSYSNPAWITALAWTKITGTPTTLSGYGITNAYTKTEVDNIVANYLPLAGGTMTGNILWTTTNKGVEWQIDTDSAYIRFISTGDADANTRLEFATTDNDNEYFRWVHVPLGGTIYESMRLTPGGSGNAELLLSGLLKVTTGADPQIWLTKTGTDAGSWRILGSTGEALRRFRIYDDVASLDRFDIFDNGNVSIGTTTDNGYKLYVNGSFYGNGTGTFANLLSVGYSYTTEPYISAHFYNTSSSNGYGGALISGIDQAHIRFQTGSNTWGAAGVKRWQIRVGNGASQDRMGIYSWTKGDDIINFFASGNVSIGNESDAYKLDVTGTGNYNSNGTPLTLQGGGRILYFHIKDAPTSGNTGVTLRTDSGSYISLATGANATRVGVVVDFNNNLAIQALPNSAWGTSTKALQINDTGAVYDDGLGNTILANNSYYNGSVNKKLVSGFSSRVIFNKGSREIDFQTAATGAADDTITYASEFLITDTTVVSYNSFGVGISPTQKFQVNNGTDLNVAINTTTVDAVTTSRISSANDAFNSVKGLVINGNPLVFHVNDAEVLRLTSLEASFTKDIRITNNEPQIYLTKTGTGANTWRILGSTGGDTFRFRIYDENASLDRFDIFSNGNVSIGTIVDNGYKLYVNGSGYYNGVLKTSGNLSVGTTSSNYTLTVKEGGVAGAPLFAFIGNSSNSSWMRGYWLAADETTQLAQLTVNGTNSMYFGTVPATTLYITTNNTTRLTIDGTSGASTFSGNVFASRGSSNDFGESSITVDGSGTPAASLYLREIWNGVAYPVVIQATKGSVYGNASADLVIKTSYYNGSGVTTAERFRITELGLIGVGCIPSTWEGTEAIQFGSTKYASIAAITTDLHLNYNAYYSATGWKSVGNGYASNIGLWSGNINFRVSNGSLAAANTAISWITPLQIGNNGLITYELNSQPVVVNSFYVNFLLKTDSTANYQRIRFDVGSQPYWGITREGSTNNFLISGYIGTTWTDNNFKIFQATGNLALNGNGTDYGKRLQVFGDLGLGGVSSYNWLISNVNDTNWGFGMYNSGSVYKPTVYFSASSGDGSNRGFRVYNVSGGYGEVFFVNYRGDVTANAYFESSDVRLKSNIRNLDIDASKIVAKIYEKNGIEEIGYIAQDVDGIINSAISKREDGYLELSYRQIHTAKIAALEKEIKELKEQLNKNKNENN